MTKFPAFQPRSLSTPPSSISASLCRIMEQIEMFKPRYALKELIGLYFCGRPASTIISRPVQFQFIQQPQTSRIQIDNVNWPVFDQEEGKLYRVLFDQLSTSAYTLTYSNASTLRKRIQRFQPYFRREIEMNAAFGTDSLRQLRLWSLVNEYNVNKETLQSVLGLRTWVFGGKRPPAELDAARETLIRMRGIKISDL